MRVLYVGTPDFSACCLEEIIGSGIEVAGVVTQPDRPSGRSLSLHEPPVKTVALKHNIPVFQPEKASNPEFIDGISDINPDVTAVFAFGEFLSDRFIAIGRLATVNLHLSLLPEYRGAAPVHRAIARGEKETGVTTFHIVREMDAGDIIYQERAPVMKDDTAGSLTWRLTSIGSKVLIRTIEDLCKGTAPRIPQDHSKATFASKLKKTDGLIDWSKSAREIDNLVRGMNPWPSAYSYWNSPWGWKMLKFFAVTPTVELKGVPGQVFNEGGEFIIPTGNGSLRVDSVQLEGRRTTTGIDFINGHREITGACLTSQS